MDVQLENLHSQGPKLTFLCERQLAIKYKSLVARGQIVVAKNSPSLFFK